MNGKKIRVVSSRDPLSLPWKEEARPRGAAVPCTQTRGALARALVQGMPRGMMLRRHHAPASPRPVAGELERQVGAGELSGARARPQNIDLVIEGTGVFLDRPGAGKHLQAGAKKVGPPRAAPSIAVHACAPERRRSLGRSVRAAACAAVLYSSGFCPVWTH